MKLQGLDLIWLANHQPDLKFDPSSNEIAGKLSFCAGFDSGSGKIRIGEDDLAKSMDSFLCDSFLIRIALDFPDKYGRPMVFLSGDRVNRLAKSQSVEPVDLHFYSNGACCLGITYVPDRKQTLEGFLKELLIPFFYRVSFTEKHGIDAARRDLWGEYSHGARGIQEYEGEINDLAKQGLGRNAPCPCGSGRKYKHCHLEEIKAVRLAKAQGLSKSAEIPC